MTDKESTKTEKEAVNKQPAALKDEQLDSVRGGTVGLTQSPQRSTSDPASHQVPSDPPPGVDNVDGYYVNIRR